MERQIIFGICSDLHHDTCGVDERWRVEKFVNEATERKADFIIQLGDFIRPDETGRQLLDVWEGFKGPRYHVLGNHDCEHSTKEEMMAFQGQIDKYYSFDCNGFHFIVLDTNYYKFGKEYVDYGNSNYHWDFPNCYISPEQLEWLKCDIDSTDKRCFVFTHATLEVGDWTVYNIHQVTDVFKKANEKAGYNKVTMCISGHDHADEYLLKGGIHYMIINSMSHKYTGKLIPYKDPLYAFIEVYDNGLIRVIGKQSEYAGESPLVHHWEFYASPQIQYREFWTNGMHEFKN